MTRFTGEPTSKVLSTVFCLKCKERQWEENPKDLQNFAELSKDPKASLPPIFTICSTVSTPFYEDAQMLFMLLGNDGERFLNAKIFNDKD